MFWSKPKQPSRSIYDNKYEEMWMEFINNNLSTIAQNVIVKLAVIDLYPDGPDKQAAIEDCEKEKHKLLCAIGHYDGLQAELKRYWRAHKDDLIACATWNPDRFASSHKIIELAYYNFKRR